jgi:malonate-semialdehyde dehydrogenase (acetylating)/methylmalonate-semialdehyde dehydrogenase
MELSTVLQNYINGQWCTSHAIDFLQVINPATVECLEENLDNLAETITLECGKTFAESKAEIRRASQLPHPQGDGAWNSQVPVKR